MRSWLFIKGDKPVQLAKASMVGADALVVDCEKLPSGSDSAHARSEIAEWLTAHQSQVVASKAFTRWVRIKPLNDPQWREDLIPAMQGVPDGILLPKASSPEQVRQLGSELYELEQRWGIEHNTTRIIPQIGDSARAALTMRDFMEDPHPRLAGFAWNASNLAGSVGAQRTHLDDGGLTDTMRMVRSTTLLLAKAMGLIAIETPVANAKDVEAGKAAARSAKLDGFAGMAATHPRQVAAINEAFAATAEERADAEAIIALFASNPAANTVTHMSETYDRMALERAQNLLAAA